MRALALLGMLAATTVGWLKRKIIATAVGAATKLVRDRFWNYVRSQVAQPLGDKPQESEKEEKEDHAKVDFIQPRLVLLHENGYAIWHEAVSNLESAIPALVAEFKNKPKPVGQRAVKASSVTASLVYRGKGNPEELHVSHGTWLDEYTHFGSFSSGRVHQLVVAMKPGNPFVALENKRAASPFIGRFTSGRIIHHAQPVVLPAKTGELEITLVDYGGVTVYHGLFEYDCSSADTANLREKSANHA